MSSTKFTSTACFDAQGKEYIGTEYRIPCNATAVKMGQHSACCGPTDMCMTNGLCKQKGQEHVSETKYWSNGCTDENFDDPTCPKYCMKPNERNGTNALVLYCPTTEDWCCATGPGRQDDNCCDEEDRRFKATNQDPAPKGVYATLDFLATDDITSTRTLLPTSSPTPTSSPAASITPSSSAVPNASQPSSSNKLGLGVGLSVGLVVLIATLIAVLVCLRKKKNARNAAVMSSSFAVDSADPPFVDYHKHAMNDRSHGIPMQELSGAQELPPNYRANEPCRAELSGA